ncbi:MAG: family 10 glycosylhydrolase [Pyrinomonadaceae bacterium]
MTNRNSLRKITRTRRVTGIFAILIFLFLTSMISVTAQPLPEIDREFRAVWVATVDNIDFPTKKYLSIDEQKAELIAILDLAKKLRLNAIVFQVRPMTDALYRSKLEPWSEYLTGQMGRAQAFDPLEFLVAEAHKRGILVHAWFNPYRAYHPSAKTMSDEHVSKKQPSIVREYGRSMWLDPTDPEGQKHSLNVIADVVRRYDIDGVHFDDYFYPYAEMDANGKKIDFPDQANYDEYVKTGTQISARTGVRRIPLKRDDWRRWHVNQFIESVGREIKRIKPEIVYGVSPFGIWQPVPEKGIAGFNAYAELYADSRKWLQDGTVDYLAPQLYWETARKGLSFPVLLDWWKSQNVKKRHIWPGIPAYRIGETPTFTAGEIASQISATRQDELTHGAIFFSQKSLRKDMGGIQNELSGEVYKRDAIIPAFPWITTKRPASPEVTIRWGIHFVRVAWREKGNRKAFWFVVHTKDRNGWSTQVLPASQRSIALSGYRKIEQVIVKSVDRLGNESK